MKKVIKDHLSALNGIHKRALAIERTLEKLVFAIRAPQDQIDSLISDLELEMDWFQTQIEAENDKSNTTKPKKAQRNRLDFWDN